MVAADIIQFSKPISYVLNEQGTWYKYLISNELKNGAHHLKEHPKISNFAKFERYCFKCKGTVHGIRTQSAACLEHG